MKTLLELGFTRSNSANTKQDLKKKKKESGSSSTASKRKNDKKAEPEITFLELRPSGYNAPKLPSVFATKEQTNVIDLASRGDSFFLAGPAGSGKSVTLLRLVDILRAKRDPSMTKPGVIALTSMNARSAHEIGGLTLIDWAGVRSRDASVPEMVQSVLSDEASHKRWRDAKVLLIDNAEELLVDPELLTKLDTVSRRVSPNDLTKELTVPFAGMQLVLTGDPLQCSSSNDPEPRVLAHESPAWKTKIRNSYALQTLHRSHDMNYEQLLREIRTGSISANTATLLAALDRPIAMDVPIEPIKLLRSQARADKLNRTRLATLPSPEHVYVAEDTEPEQSHTLGDDATIETRPNLPAVLKLRKGAQVILTQTVTGVLVKGTVGTVVDFRYFSGDLNDYKWPLVRFHVRGAGRSIIDALLGPQLAKVETRNGTLLFSRFQLPVLLAWNLPITNTPHNKLPAVEIDMSGDWHAGEAYTALSRAPDLDHLQITNFNPAAIHAEPAALEWVTGLSPPPVVPKYYVPNFPT